MLERRGGFSDDSNGLNEDRNPLKGKELSDTVKSLIPNDSLFNINSHIFNIQTNKKEKISTFDCFYSPSTESLCIVIEEKNKYSDLSKEIVVNLMEFSCKVNAKTLLLLLDKKNKDWGIYNIKLVKIMQSMMMIGFSNDPKFKTAKLSDKEYKLLRMDIKNKSEVIEEVIF